MDENRMEPQTTDEQESPVYIPRPKWQVWGARICVVLFILLIIAYYCNIARGGI